MQIGNLGWGVLKNLYPEERKALSQRDLNAALLAHERLMTYQRGGAKAELAHVRLDGFNLANRNLTEADFRHSSFIGATFFGSTLERADFQCADLRDCDLSSTKLMRANMRGASICGAKLSFARLDGADLRAATVAYRGPGMASDSEHSVPVDFSNASLKGASFSHAQLEGANFAGAILEGVNFKNAKLSNATFKNAVLIGINVSALGLPDEAFDGCVLDIAPDAAAKEATLRERLEAHQLCVTSGAAKGMQAILDCEDLRVIRSSFAGKPLTGLSARRAIGIGVDFSGCQLQCARFDGADLRECNFNGADLRGASFRDARLAHATFEKANLGSLVAGGRALRADFTGAGASATQFARALLEADITSLGLGTPAAVAA